MNYLQSYDFSSENYSNEGIAMANFPNCPERTDEIDQMNISVPVSCDEVTTVKNKTFSFLWTVTNFKEFIDRQYEFSSPIFTENLSCGTSKWRMIIYPQNIYPEGIHIALRLLILSEVKRSHSVMYTISFIDSIGKHHKLKIREKVFRHILDFDESPVISNINLKKKDLLMNNSLVIKCEFDLLECENRDDIIGNTCYTLNSPITKSCENLDSLTGKSSEFPSYQNDKMNTPTTMQSLNDLSFSVPHQKPSDSEKDVNVLIKKDSALETGEFDVSDCKNKGLEILSNDLKHLYFNTNQHDVVIYADDGKHTAHEIILTSRSDYFKKALMSQKEISIPGINVETLDAVLYYLYTGKLKQMSENSALDLLKASKILELPFLENMTAETFLCSRIRTNNVTNVFLMAKELKIESLKNSALKFMAENREEVMKTKQWNDLMRNDPHSAGEVLLTVSYYQNKVVNNV